jgi:hypothetical protein
VNDGMMIDYPFVIGLVYSSASMYCRRNGTWAVF